ncbi:MAG: hypothetical protein ACK53H_07565 [Betaproteobacteria bacterium]|jgi:antitoxin HicB
MSYEYAYAILFQDDGSAILDFKKFPEIVCEITKSDLQENAVKAIAFDAVKNALQARIDYDDVIPVPDRVGHGRSEYVVALSGLDTLKLSLYEKFRSSNCSRAEFAKRAAVTPTGLSRLLDLSHASRFDVLTNVFDKVGYKVSTNIARKRAPG